MDNNVLRLVSLIVALIMASGNVTASEEVLEKYIRDGIENNLALQQKRENYRMSLELLNEARGMFYPSLTFNMRYSLARGGRVIDFPLGDLFNPVYRTLNMLTGTQDFSEIDNESFYFYRPREQESKFRVVQPVIYPEIRFNKKIREHESELGHIDIDIYRRALVAEIKTAYFNYLKTLKIEELVENTISLLEENLRVNERLLQNDMVTVDYIYRSRAELEQAKQQLADAGGKRKIATAWFNFLLNRELDEAIALPGDRELFPGYASDYKEHVNKGSREELLKTERMLLLADDYIRLKKSYSYPRITAVFEYGIQGRSYSFGRDDDFIIASVVLSVPVFEGFRNRTAIQQARIQREIAELAHREVRERIGLEEINAWYELEASAKAVDAAYARAESARAGFRVTDRRFKEGGAPLIEYIDARTNMTSAEINMIVSRYEFFARQAEYERVTASYIFD